MYALVLLAAFGGDASGEERLLAKLDADVEKLLAARGAQPMFRFTIRELLLLTMTVGLVVG
jgi:hypothetical protein